jgi:alanine dehydrogenase
MNIGVPLERGATENRVALTPAGVRTLTQRGHALVVQSGAGLASRFDDEEYRAAGARVVYDREEVFGRSELLLKVARPDPGEARLVARGQTILAFHHLAAAPRGLVEALLDSGATLIGYEVIEDAGGDLPVLHAMSEIAGQLAVHIAAHNLETRRGGRGILLGGATGIPAAHVVILGAGVVGTWAARTALGNGAQVTLLDSRLAALRRAEEKLGTGVVTEMAHERTIDRASAYADALIGAVLVRGERSPHLVSRDMVRRMKPGAVIVDLSIDQGGCVETSRPTSLVDPIYVESEVTHYAVPNTTSAVARTASLALTYASLPPIRALADLGVEAALRDTPGLAAGVYAYRGELVSDSVARALGQAAQPLGALLGNPYDPRPVPALTRE